MKKPVDAFEEVEKERKAAHAKKERERRKKLRWATLKQQEDAAADTLREAMRPAPSARVSVDRVEYEALCTLRDGVHEKTRTDLEVSRSVRASQADRLAQQDLELTHLRSLRDRLQGEVDRLMLLLPGERAKIARAEQAAEEARSKP